MTDKGEVYMLAQRVSKLETSQEHTATAIEELTKAVKELAEAMNIGKGWAKAFMFLSGGSFVGFVTVIAIMLGLYFTGR